MTILVTNEELAKDVVGAEALLERHRVTPHSISACYWLKYMIALVVRVTRVTCVFVGAQDGY